MQPPGHKDNTSPPNEFGRKGKHAIIAFGNAYIHSSRITNSTEQRKIKINFVFPLICTNFAAKL
jgi:hypothetical protein